MKVTIELIDELRSRVNVSYEEAKRVLEKNDGDLIKSIIELENKRVPNVKEVKAKDGFSEFLDKVLQFRLSIKNRAGDTLLNIPLVLAGLVLIMAFWVVLFCLVVTIFTSCKIKVFRTTQTNMFDDLKGDVKNSVDKVKKTADKIFDDKKEAGNNNNQQYQQYNGYQQATDASNKNKPANNDKNNSDEIIIE